jgi:glutamate 5-kinase
MKDLEGAIMRESLRDARRIVVKVGTTTLTRADGRLDPKRVDRLVGELCGLLDEGREVVCVTSGAIAAGLGPLGLDGRPKDMPTLQAAAAVGQSHLMDAYNSAFESRGHVCAQVLLTRSDFVHRQQYVNALNTFQKLLVLGAVPVVNENDTVAIDEIRFGENDLLAALVANLVRADVLVMLSDVDGLHEGRDGPIIPEVEAITPEVERLAGGSASALGSGGMRSKLDAARIATASGVPAVIAAFRRGALGRVLEGRTVGTLFAPSPSRLTSRKAWIGYATSPKGTVVVDAGARRAICEGNRSLLAAGVDRVEGSFAPGDAVNIVDETGHAFARGLVGFSSEELSRIAGMDSARVSEMVGDAREVVHRDELVVL